MTNANYGLDDDNGNQITTGLPAHTARSTAQRMADERAKTLYLYELGSDADPEVVKPKTVRCACGEWTGERCEWIGMPSETVMVEYMPPCLRASHEAAHNHGTYPANGAVRVRVERGCADLLLEDEDEREWSRVVSEDA